MVRNLFYGKTGDSMIFRYVIPKSALYTAAPPRDAILLPLEMQITNRAELWRYAIGERSKSFGSATCAYFGAHCFAR